MESLPPRDPERVSKEMNQVLEEEYGALMDHYVWNVTPEPPNRGVV